MADYTISKKETEHVIIFEREDVRSLLENYLIQQEINIPQKFDFKMMENWIRIAWIANDREDKKRVV